MRIPVAWLKTFLPKLPPTQKLVETLMMHGLDVEEVIDLTDRFNQVVVGEILAVRPHPNADKLRLVDVMVQPKTQPLEIVCGAPNIAAGQKVAVALIGAKLPNGLTIAKRAIRGVESNGMVCAADELGLGHNHSGIMVLDPALKVGTAFAQVTGGDEVIIDVAVPANRADLMAMRGLAREIGAMLGLKPKFSKLDASSTQKNESTTGKKSVTLKITDPKLCTLLTARVIREVRLQTTPAWMASRLNAAGMRSINIVADIANYVMLEYGQPLHAYDAAKVHGQSLIARPAKPGEQLKTLDGKMRTLTPEMLVIADTERVLGIAGVMGGEDTEVTDSTKDIILESAIFNPVSIRQTSRSLGLISEASKRFEKGLWPSLPNQASAAAAALITELCGGTEEPGSVEIGTASSQSVTVALSPRYIAERLGTKVSIVKSKTVLIKLGFDVQGTAQAWKVSVPEWRPDVTLPEDIVDEVGRMTGYNTAARPLSRGSSAQPELPKMLRFHEEVKNILVDMGFSEVISHAFYSQKNASLVKGNHFSIANPLDGTQHQLRKSLLPQIETVLQKQADAGQDAMIFEIGRVFNPSLPGEVDHRQPWKLALGITTKGQELLKPATRMLQKKLVTMVEAESVYIVPVLVRGRRIEVCEFDLTTLMSSTTADFGTWDPNRHIVHDVRAREQSKYPAVTRDIAFWWPNSEDTIFSLINDLKLEYLHNASVSDRFEKDGRKSYKVNFVYRSFDRTLTKAEVDKLEQKIKDVLMKAGASIR